MWRAVDIAFSLFQIAMDTAYSQPPNVHVQQMAAPVTNPTEPRQEDNWRGNAGYADNYKTLIAKATGIGHICCGTVYMIFYFAQRFFADYYNIAPLCAAGFLVGIRKVYYH